MDTSGTERAWTAFARTPLRLRVYLSLVAAAALVLPWLMNKSVATPGTSEWVTVAALFAASLLNVEVSRWLSGGVSYAHQPHKALSAWAFATALLLPTGWLLLVVPVTYFHARWRGIRVPLWKWIGSGFYLVLCGLVAAAVRDRSLDGTVNWMQGDGGRGLLTMLAAGAAFLALEALLFTGSAFLNRAEDERWLRAMLSSRGFYLNEGGVLLLGGLFAAVWTAAPWFSLLFVPVYVLIQHAVLLAPLRERAAAAAELAAMNVELQATNAELSRVSTFKTDLMSMLGHELANPLTSVIGFTEAAASALDGSDPIAAQAALSVVDRNAAQVAAVLADIVQLVAADSGTLVAAPQPCDLAPRLHSAAEHLAQDRPPEVSCPDDLGVLVQPGHLDQILANLLTNAGKYAGGATRLSGRLDPAGHVTITVTDDGPGIPDAFQEHLFERYRRGASTSTSVAGSGIGLFISRELARANQGELVHHRDEGGTHFVLRLPHADL